jgi:glyoxylate reductase
MPGCALSGHRRHTLETACVIVTRKLPDPIETRMMELLTCRLNLDDKAFDKSEPTAAASRAEVPVPTVTDRIDAGVLAATDPALKLIGGGLDEFV